jgi:hypothetical protein
MTKATVLADLVMLGVEGIADFSGCVDTNDEFGRVKKRYFAAALKHVS